MSRFPPVVLALGLLACAPAPPASGLGAAEVATATELVPTDPYAESDVLFGLDRVHTVDIQVDEAGLDALRIAPRVYVPGAVTIDGEALPEVGVRLKGSGSFDDLDGKAAFKIDVDRYVDGARFHGLSKLTFNNMRHDSAQVHELLAWSAVRAVGLPFLRVGYAWITLNGETYGLYAHVESPDGGWMERTLGTTDGRVYEGGYPQYPENYAHADFEAAETHNFELEVGEGDEWAELDAAAAALALEDEAAWDEQAGAAFDLDAYALFQITEAWIGQWDGYAFARRSNNYRIWVDVAGDGRVRFVPSGLDYTFTEGASTWSRSRSPVGHACRRSTTCKQRLADAAAGVVATVGPEALLDLQDQAWTLIDPWVQDDPRRAARYADVRSAQADVRDWIEVRSDLIVEWYGD